jgi:hypothetical protein
MNEHSQDIKLLRQHLENLKKGLPLSLPQEGALQRIEAHLMDDDEFVANIDSVKVHLDMIGKGSLTDQQRQACELAAEVAEKIGFRWGAVR